jgi:hypothetical protein
MAYESCPIEVSSNISFRRTFSEIFFLTSNTLTQWQPRKKKINNHSLQSPAAALPKLNGITIYFLQQKKEMLIKSYEGKTSADIFFFR